MITSRIQTYCYQVVQLKIYTFHFMHSNFILVHEVFSLNWVRTNQWNSTTTDHETRDSPLVYSMKIVQYSTIVQYTTICSTQLVSTTTGCTPYKDLDSAKFQVTSTPIRERLRRFCNLDSNQLTVCCPHSVLSFKTFSVEKYMRQLHSKLG